MTSDQMFDLLLLAIGIVAAMVSAVLYRVWAIPAIQQKVDMLDEDRKRLKDNVHDVRNILQNHETRITILEETKQENPS